MLRFYSQYISEGDICFDIGANAGERSDIFLRLGAKVIALEPQKSCYLKLRKKYSRNKNMQVLQMAAGSHIHEAVLMLCAESDECSTLSRDFTETYSRVSGFHWPLMEKVSVTTLEQLCEEVAEPDFCKIDVEGYESKVFEGLNRALKCVCFEFNFPLLNDTRHCLERMAMLGDYECNFIAFEHMIPVLKKWLPLHEFKGSLEKIISADILSGEIILKLKS